MRTQENHIRSSWDHWWPKGIQRLWVNERKRVVEVDATGMVRERQPKKKVQTAPIGAIFCGHKVDLRGPWSHSIEDDFAPVDNCAPKTISDARFKFDFTKNARLLGIWKALVSLAFGCRKKLSTTRFAEVDCSENEFNEILWIIFSLAIRSPRFRYINSFAAFGPWVGGSVKLEAPNLGRVWSIVSEFEYTKHFNCDFTFIFAHNSEFVFGDGLHDTVFKKKLSLQTRRDGYLPILNGEILIALTPTMAGFLRISTPTIGEGSFVLRSMLAFDLEVDEVNQITAISSKKKLMGRREDLLLKYVPLLGEHQVANLETATLPCYINQQRACMKA